MSAPTRRRLVLWQVLYIALAIMAAVALLLGKTGEAVFLAVMSALMCAMHVGDAIVVPVVRFDDDDDD